MTLETAPADRTEGTWSRPRPKIHFTADEGWINDPYGIAWVADRYHLFYQAIPGRTTWAPNCHWGHAESTDLIHWTEQPLALTPRDFEIGCWSGSVVADHAGGPTLFYTRIAGDDWGHGKVAIARGSKDLRTWTTGRDDVVIDTPPGVHAFRDPYVFRRGDDWIMIMGAGLTDGSGAALQYRSRDLRRWSYDGVLCSRRSSRDDDVWTGALWECPQLLPLGDQWVLLVSVWDDDTLYYVAAAVGDYDGRRFAPRSWQRLTYGNSAYAMTAFRDREGRPCVLSWLREEPQNNPLLERRAGAHSVPAVVNMSNAGTLVLTPHPNVDALRGPRVEAQVAGGDLLWHCGGDPVDITLGATMNIREGTVDRAELEIGPGGAITVHRAGFPTAHLLAGTSRILLDADLLEVFTETSYAAFRIAPANDPTATVVAVRGGDAEVRRLTP